MSEIYLRLAGCRSQKATQEPLEVKQIIVHILPTISFNNPLEVQEGRKWNFNDICSSCTPLFPAYYTLTLRAQKLFLPISSYCNFRVVSCTYFFYWPFQSGCFCRVEGSCFSREKRPKTRHACSLKKATSIFFSVAVNEKLLIRYLLLHGRLMLLHEATICQTGLWLLKHLHGVCS